jgi:hypothetical protein
MSKKCYCLIPHPERAAFMIVKEGLGWNIPSLPYDENWSELSYTDICDHIFAVYGLQVTVLRRLVRGNDYMVVELEVHSHAREVKFQAAWFDRSSQAGSEDKGIASNNFVKNWFEEKEQNQAAANRPPWEFSGWHKEASDWINAEISKTGNMALDDVQQFKVGARSSVLAVATTEGRIFFKASVGETPSEAVFTQALSELWPDRIAPPLAVDSQRNWLLMNDHRSLGYTDLPESGYANATTAFAELLINSKDHLPAWKDLNCPDYSLETIESFSRDFATHLELINAGDLALKSEQSDTLVAYIKEWGALCSSLADFDFPLTLVDLDFNTSDIAYSSDSYKFFDWQETVISHPFFTVLNLFDHLRRPREYQEVPTVEVSKEELNCDVLQDAFLTPFNVFESDERVQEAFELAKAIFPVVKIKWWVDTIESLEPGSFWHREFSLKPHCKCWPAW